MSKKRLMASVLIFIIVSSCVWRFKVLNAQYPNPRLVVYQEEEKIRGGDIEMTVMESELASMEQVLKLASEIQNHITDKNGNPLRNGQKRVLLVKIKIKNVSNTEKVTSLVSFAAQSGAWANGMDFETYCRLNNVQGTYITLGAGEECNMTMPFYLYEVQFTGNKFYEIEDRKFQLVLSTYPIKNVVELHI